MLSNGTPDATGSGTRRRFLRATAAAVTGLGASVAALGTAAAGDKKCGGTDAEAPPSYPWYDVENWVDHGVPWGDDEMTFFVNGWQSNYDRATNQGYECSLALADNGYSGTVVGAHWYSVTATWSGGEAKADEMGHNLAYVVAYAQDAGSRVRLVGHSLGARVIGTCLNDLDDAGRSVDAAVLLGGAIENDSVVEDCGWWCTGEFYHGIRDAAERFDNYHSWDDAILGSLYTLAEWDDAVGESGADGTPPANYADHDVTDQVGSEHCAYYRRGDGCMDRVVANW